MVIKDFARTAAAFLVMGAISIIRADAAVKQISSGYYHSLALMDDGTVRGFGDNSFNQAVPPAGLANVKQVAAGWFHSLAVLQNGAVVAWGSQSYGAADPPVNMGPIAQVAGGGGQSLAALSDGTVRAWGENTNGQATPPAGLANVKQVAAGEYHSMALTEDGKVVVWGSNTYGQATPYPALGSTKQIAAGRSHCLALLEPGSVVGWGWNYNGTTIPPTGLSRVVQIAAGSIFSLALLDDGTVRGWGATDIGAIPPRDLRDVVQISAGFTFSTVLFANGTVKAYGVNNRGQTVVPPELSIPRQTTTTSSPATTTFASSTVASAVSTSSTATPAAQTSTFSSASSAIATTTKSLTTSTSSAQPSSSPPVGAIAGGVVGGLAVVVLIAAVAFFRMRRDKGKDVKDPTIDKSFVGKDDLEHASKAYPMAGTSANTKFSNWSDATAIADVFIPENSTASATVGGFYNGPLPAHVYTPASNPQISTGSGSTFPQSPIQTSKKLEVQASDVQIDYSVPPLGEGGFGVVYRGTLHGTNRVAIKKIRSGILDEKTMKAFFREVQAWEGLVQRNVLPLMAYCVDPPMLITDLMEQGDIRKYLSSRGWDQKLGLKLLLDVATGMTYLHSKGILHGDLKTVNVMVDNDQALIADFGLSKIKSEATRGTSSTAFAGTPGFVAPELIEGEGLQAPADVFSFAMVCYEVVSRGKMPYQGEANIAALLYKVAVEHARPPRPDGVSDDVWWLIERCWAHDPRERPTFVEIREELQRIVQGQAV